MPITIKMSLQDSFTIAKTDAWNVELQNQLPLRFANLKITPRIGDGFSMKLYFKCDTVDLSHFNTPAKIEKAVLASSRKYLSGATEKVIKLKKLDANGWYGCYTILTDAKWENVKDVPKGDFKYITRGMVRLSPDSVLGFSVMSNELNTKEYQWLVDYVKSFTKDGFIEAK